MASIKDFISNPIEEFSKIIADKELENTFDSHAFIRQFAHKFETKYVAMLAHYAQTSGQPFKEVHSLIAMFLLDKKSELHITNLGKVPSPNIFGKINDNENWQKTAT